jgi:hypothetical protein
MGAKVKALKDAGVIEEGLPEDYHEAFEKLSDEELAAILALKARLDGVKSKHDVKNYAQFVAL